MSYRPPFSDQYYSQRHLSILDECPTFEEIAPVVLDVLREMKTQHPDVAIYQVCGPITTGPGTIPEKLARFERAIQYHREKRQRIVFNQLPTEGALGRLWNIWKETAGHHDGQLPGSYCWELLHAVYYPIFSSGLITHATFIPGWEASYGTRWEHSISLQLGIQVEYMPPDWDNQP